MEPHEQRVVEEKELLDEKIVKLVDFIIHQHNTDVDETEMELLNDQLGAMLDYASILRKRIRRFEP